MAYFLKYKAGNNKELLTKNTGDPIAKAANGHEYVDLGLPSGTMWAKCYVGAETEDSLGLRFRWGETDGHESMFIEEPYKYGSIDPSNISSLYTKYNSSDNKKVLDIKDDAARVNMGGQWLMPTTAQIDELISNTTVTGNTDLIIILTSTINGNSIKIKLAGSVGRGGSANILGREICEKGGYSDNDIITATYERQMGDGGYYFTSDVNRYGLDRTSSGFVRGVLKIN